MKQVVLFTFISLTASYFTISPSLPHLTSPLSWKRTNKRYSQQMLTSEHIPYAKIVRILPYSYDNFEITPITRASSSQKQSALYLPGLDGMGFYTVPSLANVSIHYDLYKLEIPPNDRSSFTSIAMIVELFLNSLNKSAVIVGESFGGLLATYIASRNNKHISNIILINPATSFDRTSWNSISPIIYNSGPIFPIAAISTLFAKIVQPQQISRVGINILKRIINSQDRTESVMQLYNVTMDYLKLLPPETIEWRVSRWLNIGTKLMSLSRYQNISTPILLLIGNNDKLLPSYTEGYRLESRLINTIVEVKEYPLGGHGILDDELDLYDVLINSKTFGANKKEYPIDIPMPSKDDIREINQTFQSFVNAYSPVFLSRNKDGVIEQSIDSIPVGLSGRPVLLVGNHQLYGTDTGLIIREFLLKKNTLVRGLGHPMLFTNSTPKIPVLNEIINEVFPFTRSMASSELLVKFGAVEVSPTNFYALLQRNETILLFPGGGLELCHGKADAYKLFWKNTTDFVRIAAACGALIVPFGAVGCADSVIRILDADEILDNPFLGIPAKRLSSRLPRARAATPENFMMPLALPAVPRRIYFLFEQAYDTRNIDVYNKTQCKETYLSIRTDVENCMKTLLEFRKLDPYDDFFRRLAYETINRKPAPTAPLS